MKTNLLALLIVAFGINAQEKQTVDNLNYHIPSASKSATIAGNLDGTNTYDRVFGNGVDSGCAHPSTDSGSDGSSYEVFEFHSPSGQAADIEVVLNGLPDSLLFIYCDFDPLNPMNMIAGIDDDNGVGFGSAIVPADGLILLPNTSYFAVVAGFAAGDLGTYDLVLGGDLIEGPFVPVVAAPPTQVPVNNKLALGIMLLIMLAAAFMAYRKDLKFN